MKQTGETPYRQSLHPWWHAHRVWHSRGEDDGYWCDYGWWEYEWEPYSASLSSIFSTKPDAKNPTASGKVIVKKYPIIKSMLDMNLYAELLKLPFYINLIVPEITNIDDIVDEDQSRDYIGQYMICLNDSDIKKVVESIVFTRAKDFSLGVCCMNYETKIINKLISKGIVIKNEKTIRLKYDILKIFVLDNIWIWNLVSVRDDIVNFLRQ